MQENFAPFFMSLKSVSSPSGLITVTSVKSTINFRPRSSSAALRQALSSSVVHGGTNLPARTSLRWPSVSTMEILNICCTTDALEIGNAHAKEDALDKSLNRMEEKERGAMRCRKVSKGLSTHVEA